MAIFIGHISALEYWSSHDISCVGASKARPKSGEAPLRTTELEALIGREGLRPPLHILVASKKDRRNTLLFKSHMFNEKRPQPSFAKLANGFYVSTPEACFFELAQSLSFEEMLLVGFELCGFYGTSHWSKEEEANDSWRLAAQSAQKGNDTDLPGSNSSNHWNEYVPHMTKRARRTKVRNIITYLERSAGLHGSNRAMKAVRYIIDDSASPMETALALLLSLPPKHGGFGLPKPKLNFEIQLIENEKQHLYPIKGRRLWADLCWPNEKLVIEYDSDTFHAGRNKLNRDSRRRAILELEGYHVITVTKKQLFGVVAFEEVARATAKRLGHRIRPRTRDFNEKQFRLRKAVLENAIRKR